MREMRNTKLNPLNHRLQIFHNAAQKDDMSELPLCLIVLLYNKLLCYSQCYHALVKDF